MKKVIASVVSFAVMVASISASLMMMKTPMASAKAPTSADFEVHAAPPTMTATDTEKGTVIASNNANFTEQIAYMKPVSLDDFSMTLTPITRDVNSEAGDFILLLSTNSSANLNDVNTGNMAIYFTGNRFMVGHTNHAPGNLLTTGGTDGQQTWFNANNGYLQIRTEFAANGDLLILLDDAAGEGFRTFTVPKAELERFCIKDENTPIYPIITPTYANCDFSFTVTDVKGQIAPPIAAEDFEAKGAPCNISATDTGAGVKIAANNANHSSRQAYMQKVSMNDFQIKLTDITRIDSTDAWKQDIVLYFDTDHNANLDTNNKGLMLVLGKNYLMAYIGNEATPNLGQCSDGNAGIVWLETYGSLKISTEFDILGNFVITVNDGTWRKTLTIPKDVIATSCITPTAEVYPIFTTKHTDGTNSVQYSCTVKRINGQTEEKIVYSDDFTSVGTNPFIKVQDVDGGYLISNTDPIDGGMQDTRVVYNTKMKLNAENDLHLRFTELTSLGTAGMQIGFGGWAGLPGNMFGLLLNKTKVDVYKGVPAAGEAGIVGTINFPAEQTSFDIMLEMNADGSVVVTVNGSITTIPAEVVADSTLHGNEDALEVSIGMHGIGGTMSVVLNSIENLAPVEEGEGDASDATTAFGWRGQSANAVATDTEDGVKINFTNTTFVNQPMAYFDTIATKEAHKLDGLHVQIKDIKLDADNMKSLNVAFATSPYLIHEQSIIFLMNDYGAAVNINAPENPDPSFTIDSVALNQDLIDFYFIKEANGDFTLYATGNITIIKTIPKKIIEAVFGSADPSVYVNISDKWFSQTGNNNSCVVTACNNVENGFTSYYGEYLAGEEIRKRIINATYTGTFENIVINYLDNEGGMITTVRKMPLDGLTISGIDIDFNSMFRFGTSQGATTENGFTGQGPLIRLDENGDVYFTYTPSAGHEGDMIGTFSDPDQTFTIQCIQRADGGFNFFITGDKSGESFVKTASPEDITELYGSTENVMVYLSYSELDRSNSTTPKVTKIAKISNEEVEDVNVPVTKDDVSISISGDKVTVTVDMAEGMGYSYQWYANLGKDANTGGEMIEGATSTTFTIPEGWDAGDYYIYCEVTSVSKLGTSTTVATDTVKYTVEGGSGDEDGPTTGVNEAGIIIMAALLATSAAVIIFRKKRSVK